MYGTTQDVAGLLSEMLSGKGNLLSLPLLAALPYSASIFQEMNTGAARYAIFRCGYRVYLFSKITAILLSAVLSQCMGLMIFSVAISFMAGSLVLLPVHLVVQRLIAASIFAMLGNMGALIAKDIVSAYIIPVMFVFALSMFQSRFFFGAEYLNPVVWLSEAAFALPLLLAMFLLMILLTLILTTYEVRRYA